MKQLSIVLAAIVLVAIALPASPAAAQGETAVIGAGEGTFPGSAALFGIPLKGLEFAEGVTIDGSGAAAGQFQTLLLGTSLLGQLQYIHVEGEATRGGVNADGSATFGGFSSVDLGDGSLPLLDVPFSVTVTTQGLRLVIGTTTLPGAGLTAGQITIQ
jgi:hypothetical protein